MAEKKTENRFWLSCVGILWAGLCLIYSCYIVQFILGNHDYKFMRFGVKLSSGLWEGRFTQFFPQWLLTDGQILPILNPFIAFLLFSVAVILLAKWYALPARFSIVLPFGFLIVFHPYFITQLYYEHQLISIVLWFLLGVIGCICVMRQKLIHYVAAFFCFIMCFGGYIGSLELILTILLGKFLLDIMTEKTPFSVLLSHYFMSGLVLAVSLAFYYVVILELKKTDLLIADMHNVQASSYEVVFHKLWTDKTMPWKFLFAPFPYVSEVVKYLLASLILLTGITAWKQGKFLWVCVLLVVSGYALFFLAFISPYYIWDMFRVHCYSVPFFAAILFSISRCFGGRVERNFAWLAAIGFIICYIQADLTTQKVWLLGNRQDERHADRIRADLMPRLDKNKHYRLITLGGLNARWKFAGFTEVPLQDTLRYREAYGYSYFLSEFTASSLFLYEKTNPIWGTALIYDFFVLENEFTDSRDKEAKKFSQNYGKDMMNILPVAEVMRPYPSPSYLFLGEKDIVIMFGPDNRRKQYLLRFLLKVDD